MNRTALTRTMLLTLGLVVFIALAGWQARVRPIGAASTAQDAAPEATATRAAEVAELEALRTRLAELEAACAKVACEATPTPTVPPPPPMPMGQTVAYPGDWSVTVTGATLRPTIEELPGLGPFVQVEVEVTNLGADTRQFPFRDWVVIDAAGHTYQLTVDDGSSFETGWFRPIPPSLPTQINVLFAVTADAGDRFVLESAADPTFRVQLEMAARG